MNIKYLQDGRVTPLIWGVLGHYVRQGPNMHSVFKFLTAENDGPGSSCDEIFCTSPNGIICKCITMYYYPNSERDQITLCNTQIMIYADTDEVFFNYLYDLKSNYTYSVEFGETMYMWTMITHKVGWCDHLVDKPSILYSYEYKNNDHVLMNNFIVRYKFNKEIERRRHEKKTLRFTIDDIKPVVDLTVYNARTRK